MLKAVISSFINFYVESTERLLFFNGEIVLNDEIERLLFFKDEIIFNDEIAF